MTAILAQFHLRFVNGNLNEPGTELRVASKMSKPLKGFQHGFLGNIFRVGIVPNQAEGGKEHCTLIWTHKVVEGVSVALLHAANKREFRQLFFVDCNCRRKRYRWLDMGIGCCLNVCDHHSPVSFTCWLTNGEQLFCRTCCLARFRSSAAPRASTNQTRCMSRLIDFPCASAS